ncbi:MAG: hypothetical protein JW891_00460 [Candidatus Lokiarchaeota archaeon]|nr:hypothetical protein [Candidatus Lokiarchaeota archaeon]
MSEPNSQKTDKAEKSESISQKIESLTSVMQKFGLDLITKLGKTESRLNILADKIDNLAEATITIKAFSPILSKIVDNQKYIESELDLLKSLAQKSQINNRSVSGGSLIERDESITNNFTSIENQFSSLREQVDTLEDATKAIASLTKIKEDLFELTGGHRILYEISQFITFLENSGNFNDKSKNSLKEKIVFWKNKLK